MKSKKDFSLQSIERAKQAGYETQVSDWLAYEWKVKTPVGDYHFVIREYKERRKPVTHTIYGCFCDVDAAKAKIGCNPHSGKWNHHGVKAKDIYSGVEIDGVDYLKCVIETIFKACK